MLTFKAKYLQDANIKRYGLDKKYHDYNVSFVKLDTRSLEDRLAINNANAEWDNCQSYANEICKTFNRNYLNKTYLPKERYYALTLQKKDFDNLKYYDILGLVQTNDFGTICCIDYLQTDPQFKYGSDYRTYKGIGEAIINSLVSITAKGKEILLDADESAINFYKKLKFKQINNGTGMNRFI